MSISHPKINIYVNFVQWRQFLSAKYPIFIRLISSSKMTFMLNIQNMVPNLQDKYLITENTTVFTWLIKPA